MCMEMLWKEDNYIEVIENKFKQAERETRQAQLYTDMTGDVCGNAYRPNDSEKWTVSQYGVYVMTQDELESNYTSNEEIYYFVENFLHTIFPEEVATVLTEKFGDYCDETLDGRPLQERLVDLMLKK